jgi:hypothetical protein
MHWPSRITMIILYFLVYTAIQVCAQSQYTVRDLGEFAPSDVNEAGEVIGRVGGKPAKYKDGVVTLMQDLGYGGKPQRWSDATPGVSVGYVGHATGALVAAQWDASGALTLLYTRDQLHGSLANGQNAAGVTSGFGGRFDSIYGGPVSSAFRWDDPQHLTILDTVDGSWSESIGIDGEGNVWGLDKDYHSVVWDKHGVKSVLQGNPGRWPNLIAVNRAGVAVGFATSLTSYEVYPVQATIAKGFSFLPILSAGAQCQPIDVNNPGASIGSCYMPDGSTVPVQWEGGSVRRLPIAIPSGVRNLTLTGMNDQGMVTALGFIQETGPDGFPISRTRGFLFSPVYESPSLAVHLNQASFSPGETLRVDLQAHNPGPILTTDVYVGIILPDGVSTLFLTSLSPLDGVMTTIGSDPRTFAPLLKGVSWPASLDFTQKDSWVYTRNGFEGNGTYHVLVGWTKPNSLADGLIDEGDVLALAWAPFRFTRTTGNLAARAAR